MVRAVRCAATFAAVAVIAAACGGGDSGSGGEAPPVGSVAVDVGDFFDPVSLSPDGRWIAHVDGGGAGDTVCLLELVDGATPSCAGPEVVGSFTMTWSDDSTRVVTGSDPRLLRLAQTVIVDRDGTSTPVGRTDDSGDGPLQWGGAFWGDAVVFFRSQPGVDTTELVLDTADGDERVVADVPGLAVWPVIVEGDEAVVTIRPESTVGVLTVDLESGAVTEVAGTEGWTATARSGSTVLAFDQLVVGGGTGDAPFALIDLDDGDVVEVAREGSRGRAAALTGDGDRLAVVWAQGNGSDGDVVVGVADVDALRSGDATWVDTPLDGPGPITDLFVRMRWTSEQTITMVVDGAVETIEVGDG
jgi:hypothetical protein